jgi:hypothetical protein
MQAQRIESMITESDDVLLSGMMQRSLVWIYALVGEYDHAIDNLEYLLATPSFVSVPYLEVEQFPGNLDQHPRFQRLVKGVLAPPLS